MISFIKFLSFIEDVFLRIMNVTSLRSSESPTHLFHNNIIIPIIIV